MKKSNEISLKEALEEFLRVNHLDGKLLETRAINAWQPSVGKLIARHTLNLSVSNGVMHIKVDSAELRQELMYQKSKIIRRLNKEVGQEVITDLIIG